MDYDRAYREVCGFFGEEPEPFFKDQAGLIAKDGIALDIGAGQGRHTLYLARHGIRVDAIDQSNVAVESIRKAAGREDLAVRAFCCAFEDFEPEVESYDAILLCGIIQEQTWGEIAKLVASVNTWTRMGSLLFVTAFRTDDPAVGNLEKDGRGVAKNSYVNADGAIRTYLEPGQIMKLFPKFEPVYHQEGLGPEHCHGDGPPERHARIEAVLRRV